MNWLTFLVGLAMIVLAWWLDHTKTVRFRTAIVFAVCGLCCILLGFVNRPDTERMITHTSRDFRGANLSGAILVGVPENADGNRDVPN